MCKQPSGRTVCLSRIMTVSSCHIWSDSQTTGLTLTTGVRWISTKRRGVSNMNIHYENTGLPSAVWKVTLRSTWGEEGGCILIAHMRDIKESAGTRQLEKWRCDCVRNLKIRIKLKQTAVFSYECLFLTLELYIKKNEFTPMCTCMSLTSPSYNACVWKFTLFV